MDKDLLDAVIYDAQFASDDEILAEARERVARAESIRGLRKPHDAPPESWWSTPERYRGRKADGQYIGRYLFLRWRDPDSNRLRGRSLGRLDNATT